MPTIIKYYSEIKAHVFKKVWLLGLIYRKKPALMIKAGFLNDFPELFN